MNHHRPISGTMQRAGLLLDANWYQDHSDRALVKLQDLQRQVQGLQAECQKIQASIQELVAKAEERLQVVNIPLWQS